MHTYTCVYVYIILHVSYVVEIKPLSIINIAFSTNTQFRQNEGGVVCVGSQSKRGKIRQNS